MRKRPALQQSHLKRRKRFKYETLEARQLLAAELMELCAPVASVGVQVEALASAESESVVTAELPPAVIVEPTKTEPQETHILGDQTFRFNVASDRVVIRLADPDQPLRQRELDGLRLVRSIDAGIAVYEGLDANSTARRTALLASPRVDMVSELLVSHDDGAEFVVLDEIIVAMAPGADAAEVFGGMPEVASYRPLLGTADQYVVTVSRPSGAGMLKASSAMAENEAIAWAEPNFYRQWEKYFTPNDGLFSQQWYLEAGLRPDGQPGLDANLTEAWDVNQGGSSNIVVAVVDDGIDLSHYEFNYWQNTADVAGNGIDDDGNGWVDDRFGWNFVGNNNNINVQTADDNHGTAVAGMAAGIGNNGFGIAGAAYKSRVMSVRIFNGGVATNDANIASALYYAAGRTADGSGTWDAGDVVLSAWGSSTSSAAITDALTWGTTAGRQGVGAAFFFGSGNSGASSVAFPASASETIPGVVGVGAITNLGTRPTYSQYGSALDVVAPSAGGSLGIVTTDRLAVDGYDKFDDFTKIDSPFTGTSPAAAITAGVGALTLAQADVLGITLNPSQLRGMIRNNTDLQGGVNYTTTTGKNSEYGFGSINAGSILNAMGTAEISIISETEDLVSGTSTVDFPPTIVSQFSDYTLRVRNQGTSPLDLTSLAVTSGPFSIASDFGSSTLAVGESTTFVVRFEPIAGGLANGTVEVQSSDSNEATFVINVTGVGVIISAGGVVFEDFDGDGQVDTGELPAANQRVYLDANDNDVFDVVSDSHTTNTPVNIVDLATVTSPIVVSGATTSIEKMTVNLNITHTWNADLHVNLLSPSGTRLLLFDRVGGSSDNFINTTFDDDAAISITAGTAPFTGTFRPENPLSTFIGEDANGTWTLEVFDEFNFDQGVIQSWTVSFQSPEQNTITAADGSYAFFDLPNGSYTARHETSAGSQVVFPVATEYPFIIDEPTDSNQDFNFGYGINNRFYGAVVSDLDEDGEKDEDESGLADRELFVDSNANGVFDAPSENSVLNTNPLGVPDNTTVFSTIAVSGLEAPIRDLNVRVNLTHTWNSDVEIRLVSPDGTRIQLVNRRGGSSDNFTNTIFDDEAATPVASGTGPFAGSFRPDQPLSSFDGKDPNGTWTLEIQDWVGGDTGTLTVWELAFTNGGETTALSDANGNVRIDLLPGAHDVILLPEDGWYNTLPADGKHSINVAGAPLPGHVFGVLEDRVEVLGLTVGDGTDQRSRVESLTVEFDEEVMIESDAFEVLKLDPDGGAVDVAFTTDLVEGRTVATLTFSGVRTEFGSLVDGNYSLRIIASKVTNSRGTMLDGDGDGTAGGDFMYGDEAADNFFRLFGDIDGDRDVDTSDFNSFRTAFGKRTGQPGYLMPLDFNNNGANDVTDYNALRRRFGTNLGF